MLVLKTILVYVLSIPLVGLTGNLFLLPAFLLGKHLLKRKLLNLGLSFFVDVGSNIFMLFVIYLLCNLLTVRLVWAMWCLPSFITVMADFRRIDRVKSGQRIAEVSLQETGEMHHGSPEFQIFLIRSEYVHLTGDILGLLLGAAFFFKEVPYF